jgi:hypothetical protein
VRRWTAARWWFGLPDDRGRDALDAVRAHLDDAHAAADRLVEEARRQAEDAGEERAEGVPPRGWAAPGVTGQESDLQALLALLGTLREAVPAELSRQLAAALRELLLALRALIDWYLERLGEPGADRARVEVEDIPLD